MSVRRLDDGTLALEGVCGIEDAEVLLQHLIAAPASVVDWRACEGAHTAVVQVLLAAGTPVHGVPRAEHLAKWVAPLLQGRTEVEAPAHPARP